MASPARKSITCLYLPGIFPSHHEAGVAFRLSGGDNDSWLALVSFIYSTAEPFAWEIALFSRLVTGKTYYNSSA